MPLVGYYDGSGKSVDTNCKLLTLSGICGPSEAWDEFEDAWRECLRVHNAPDKEGHRYFHTTDAVSLQRDFSKGKGWTDARVNALVMGLFRVLISENTRTTLRKASIPVVLDDFRKAHSEFTNPFPDSAESFCVELCMSNAVNIEESDHGKSDVVQLYFDRNEPFMHKVRRVFERDKRKPSKCVGWIKQTDFIAPLEAHKTPGLQAADLIGWTTSRHYTRTGLGTYEGWYRMLGPLVRVRMPSDAYRYGLIKRLMRENS
jgi:hypothetical protein